MLKLEGDKVIVSNEVKTIMSFINLDKFDKSKNKGFINDVLTYIYFVYGTSTPYKNKLISSREKIVEEEHLKEYSIKAILGNKYAVLFIEYCKKNLYCSISEEIYSKTIEDIDKTLSHLKDIPLMKTKLIDREIRTYVEGKEVFIPVKEEFEFDNSKEKMDSYKLLVQMMDLKEQLEGKIEKERSSSRSSKDGQRMFDKKIGDK